MAQLPNLGLSNMIRTTTGTVTAVLQSADLFTAYIDKVKADQVIDHAIHREKYAAKAVEQAALEEAERILELEAFSNKSERHHELLQSSISKYAAIIEAVRK